MRPGLTRFVAVQTFGNPHKPSYLDSVYHYAILRGGLAFIQTDTRWHRGTSISLLGKSVRYSRKFKSDCPYGPGIPHAITEDDVYMGLFIPKVIRISGALVIGNA
ncbi:hypothetical protein BC826DRAFT_1023463 [Russula brevipes]|nr:hypothetical protein BC826DRAFT_1023463 [Russula brevipes]